MSSDCDEQQAIETARKIIAGSFTDIHQRLLDLAIKKILPNEDLAKPLPPTGPITSKHLQSMAAMVELEFLASLEKEMNDSEEKSVGKPAPFDIFSCNRPRTRGQ